MTLLRHKKSSPATQELKVFPEIFELTSGNAYPTHYFQAYFPTREDGEATSHPLDNLKGVTGIAWMGYHAPSGICTVDLPDGVGLHSKSSVERLQELYLAALRRASAERQSGSGTFTAVTLMDRTTAKKNIERALEHIKERYDCTSHPSTAESDQVEVVGIASGAAATLPASVTSIFTKEGGLSSTQFFQSNVEG